MTAFNIVTQKPVIASRTLEAIEQAIVSDGGIEFRRHLRTSITQAEDAYSTAPQSSFRYHLGASIIGNDCARLLWYMYRWATPNASMATKNISHGQMLRLFNRGHLEEARFVAMLRMIGCEVFQYDSEGKQFRVVAHGGHFGGSGDGVVRGIPDCPDLPLVLECKTHSDDSFSALSNNGVREANPQHYVQMQMYMGGWGLRGALYFSVNKDNDDLWAELVEFNQELFLSQSDRAKKIIEARFPPPKISESPGWWKCKMCRQRFICHKIPDDITKQVPEPHRNCRTCVHSRPVDGGWICTNMKKPGNFGGIRLYKQDQINGCELYEAIDM